MYCTANYPQNASLPNHIFFCNREFLSIISQGKQINRLACGSAHTLAWSTSKSISSGKLPDVIPIEYSHLRNIATVVLRNRLIMLHHFSEMFCSTFPMFDLTQVQSSDQPHALQINTDTLRAVLVSSVKV